MIAMMVDVLPVPGGPCTQHAILPKSAFALRQQRMMSAEEDGSQKIQTDDDRGCISKFA